jgi:hypothetical protein
MKADAFISHASANADFAGSIVKSLEADGLTAWIDSSGVRFGSLLRNQIHEAISDCRVLVLLWSKAAAESRWVMAEIFTAVYLDRFIVPVVLDKAALPQFLANGAYLDRKRDKDRIGPALCREVREAPAHTNDFAPVIKGRNPALENEMDDICGGQYRVLAAIENDFEKAAKDNQKVGTDLRKLQKKAPLHPKVLNLAGYQCKNDFLVKHWDAIQSGRTPNGKLLRDGERYFFQSLCIDPFDESAINGLGNILFLGRDLDAAELFHRRADEVAVKRTGKHYAAAVYDLEQVLAHKAQQLQMHR